jgi:NAD+ kinase
MKFALHGRQFNDSTKPYIQALLDELSRRHIDVQLSEVFFDVLKKYGVRNPYTSTYKDLDDIDNPDFILSLGGDGTLLDTVTHVGARETPIVGINVGRLGFLATISPNAVKETIPLLLNNEYTIDSRTLLNIESDSELFGNINFGLNDFVITKTETSSMIVVHCSIDDEFLNYYWADGLVVSTPTGSTGYSLSVGGPVLLPHCQNFIIAPISPHNLNVRPMVVEDTSTITVQVSSRSGNCLVSLDSRSRPFPEKTTITIRKEAFKASLVKMKNDKFLHTLRSKLNWGTDIRQIW